MATRRWSTAYEMGRQAHRDGKRREDCPSYWCENLRSDWIFGWNDRDREHNPPQPMLSHLHVHLADSERGNSTMASVAALCASDRIERALLVTVYEHAGWWLSFLFDDVNAGTVVGTANDDAVFHGAAASARVKYYGTHFLNLGTVRRNGK